MRINFLNNKSGQTLIELIVAGAVILISFSAFLSMTIAVYSGAATSQDYVTASNLAREGLELVRNIRDTNWLAGNDFSVFTNGLADNTYKIDYLAGVLTTTTCSLNGYNSDCRLFVKDNFYSIDNTGTILTKYYRRIHFTQVPETAAYLIKAVSVVSWQTKKGGEEEVELEVDFYDWY